MNNFREYLAQKGIKLKVVHFSEGTRTAQDASRALGCEVGQIAKTIAFRAGDRPILVALCGSSRVNLDKLSAQVGSSVRIMTANEVKKELGYTIGGVPAFGYPNQPITFIDSKLFRFTTVYSAAGTPNAVYPISPQKLCKFACAHKAEITQ